MTKIKNYKAFTLIEALIVLTIIVVLVGIGIPVFRSIQPDIQLNGAARDLISDLRWVQQFTITEQIEYCVCFFSLNGGYEKRYQIIRCGASDPQCGDAEPVLIKEKLLPREIKTFTISDSFINNEVRYNPYGAVKKTGLITLTNTKDREKIINVRPSGFVRIAN